MSLWRTVGGALVIVVVTAAVVLVWSAKSTRRQIDAFERTVVERSAEAALGPTSLDDLPAPVRRYFAFAFPDGPPAGVTHAELEMEGRFRRPLADGFEAATARQVVSTRAPEFVFSIDTTVAWPAWAIAYDAYVAGEMAMRARLLSTLTVMEQEATPELNRSSLRRWLLESPTYPMALLPGGPVTWESIDDAQARATVTGFGQEASLIASFAPGGALTSFGAEEDGDLTTPYHGSGEHAARGDYTLVDRVRVPLSFEIGRVADGEVYPFWVGRVTSVRFGRE